MSTHQAAIPKDHWRELVVFGGRPAFDRDLHVSQPNVGNRDRLIERIHTGGGCTLVYERRADGPTTRETPGGLLRCPALHNDLQRHALLSTCYLSRSIIGRDTPTPV